LPTFGGKQKVARNIIPDLVNLIEIHICYLEVTVGSLSQIKHVVVVMFENRSFDNMLGWLYPTGEAQPSQFLPGTSGAPFEGLKPELWNPSNESYFSGAPPDKVPISSSAPDMTTPDVDPEEQFHYVSEQIYGTEYRTNILHFR
jgi:hypothetical protein